MLLYIIEAEKEKELFMDYVGQCLWDIATSLRAMGGAENDMPQYIELSHPEKQKKKMTAEQIKNHVLEGLR